MRSEILTIASDLWQPLYPATTEVLIARARHRREIAEIQREAAQRARRELQDHLIKEEVV